MISVLLADDHRLLRAGLESLLTSVGDISVVATAADGAEAVEAAATHRPDVILMDLSMPRMGGVEATRRIVRADPTAVVVALTAFSDRRLVLDAIDAGAIGYLLKDADPDELVRGVRAAASGESPIAAKVARTLISRRTAPRDGLTDREHQVLALLARGMPNKQIGRALGISERTVKVQLTNIFARINAADRTEAALWAQRHGIGAQGPVPRLGR
jgi:DNA-binding NarL/FixJ family response regulator